MNRGRLPVLSSLQAAMVAASILGLAAGDYGLAAAGPLVVWISWKERNET